MTWLLCKKGMRQLRRGALKYVALGLMVGVAVFMVVSLVGASDVIIGGVTRYAEESRLEDGQFQLFLELDRQALREMEDLGVEIEEMPSVDVPLENESVLRVGPVRRTMNRILMESGNLPSRSDEIVLEKNYARARDIALGDEIRLSDRTFRVVGTGATSDYDTPFRNLTDFSCDCNAFGTAFVTPDAFESLERPSPEYLYAYRLNGRMTDEEWREELLEIVAQRNELLYLLPREDNPRIFGSLDDVTIDWHGGLVAGVIVVVLFAYIISIFVVHELERESAIIGSLYALGVRRRTILMSYLFLPTILVLVFGVLGTVLGFSDMGVGGNLKEKMQFFSFVELPVVYPPYLIFYGILMPPIIAACVIALVIRKKLAVSAIRLMRGDRSRNRYAKFSIGKAGFIRSFRIRHMAKEMRASIGVVCGIFLSLLLVIMAVNCYVLCAYVEVSNVADTRFEYMYLYRYPTAEVPEGGEAAFAKDLEKEVFGRRFNVTLLGVDEDNRYFDVRVGKKRNEVVVSSAFASKFGISKGDRIVLEDVRGENLYAFDVADITQYSVGFYVFMDIDLMRERFEKDADYFNVVFSDRELEIPEEHLSSVVSKDDIIKTSVTFLELMWGFVVTLLVVSVMVFVVVMYLLMNIMIERSARDISMMKILGYRSGELKRLFLNGNFWVIAVGSAVALPIVKWLMDAIYPFLVANIRTELNMQFSPGMYLLIYSSIMVLYFVIHSALTFKLRRIPVGEVLKQVE